MDYSMEERSKRILTMCLQETSKNPIEIFRKIANQEFIRTLYEMINRMKATYGTFRMFGSTAHQQKAIYELDLTSPLLLFIGNETKGLSYAYKELCDELCTIPMAESSTASSFNVSCAASIMMYEVVRQRKTV